MCSDNKNEKSLYTDNSDIDIRKRKEKGDEQNNMAEPIRLGALICDPEDVREFEENMSNPKVTKEQIEFIKEAIRVYKRHPF